MNSFFSVSILCSFPSSRKNNLPGPHVGKADSEHTILPPVDDNAESAAFRVGSSAGSGLLIREKSSGIRARRDEMIDLTMLA